MTSEVERRPRLVDGRLADPQDVDPGEIEEWIESLDAVVDHAGPGRARQLLLRLNQSAQRYGVLAPGPGPSDYVNTIPASAEPSYPGDEDLERRILAAVRWNAAMIVHRAQRPGLGLGGHLSTYASTATLYEVGFNHFFRGRDADGGGDQVYFQGHASPGVYARAVLELVKLGALLVTGALLLSQ